MSRRRLELHVVPPLMLNSKVPPVPVTLPMEMEPLVSMHPVQITIDNG